MLMFFLRLNIKMMKVNEIKGPQRSPALSDEHAGRRLVNNSWWIWAN